MKKIRYAVLALLLTVLAAGCAKNNTDKNEAETSMTAVSTTAVTSAETAAPEKTEAIETTETAAEEPFTLLDLKVKELSKIKLRCIKYINRYETDNNMYYSEGYLDEYRIISEKTLELGSTARIRSSAGFVFPDEKNSDSPINSIMESLEWEWDLEPKLEDIRFGTAVAVIDDFVYSEDMDYIETDEMIYSYEISPKNITGFIRRLDNGYYEIIPDPAYCYGIPMLHKTGGDCYHRINDISVYMDSPVFYAKFRSPLDNVGEDFVYAKMDLHADCIYSTNNGYISADQYKELTGTEYSGKGFGTMRSFEILSEDTYSVLTSDFTPKETESEAYRMYSLLTENKDTLVKETTSGIILADLDFDGTPEIISTYTEKDENGSDKNRSDIYSVKNGKAVFIDTITSGDTTRQMFISCGIDHNNEPAWLYMPDDEEVFCRTFKLDGDKLVFEDIFKSHRNEDGSMSHSYLGKELDIESTGEEDEYRGELYVCKGYDLAEIKGPAFDVIGMVQKDYFSRFDKIYNLFAYPFISLAANHPGIADLVFLEPNGRSFTYGMAYLADSYYNGEYISEAGGYSYHFYGDYEKPVIYLYPEKETEVSVKVNLKDGELTCTYPDHGDGWNVTAYPDGTLINSADGREYSYL
ncbi:MAG: hypothetical protein IJ007_08060, partial [Oscillospiraceae bacterium]|nr:hypothetical protein [Oscillospiraceae bacterium]